MVLTFSPRSIVIGVPLALGGFKCFIGGVSILGFGLIANEAPNRNDDAIGLSGMGRLLTVFGAGATAGGVALAYSGIKDLNEPEEAIESDEANG